MTSPSQSTANRQISRAAGTVMAAIICSNLIGLVRSMIIANAYGTSPELEAFNAANRVGELLFNLMAGGALASAFVPTFTGLLVKEQREAAWKLASSIANLLFVILTAASLLAMFFAPWIVDHALAKGFSPEMRQLTVQILQGTTTLGDHLRYQRPGHGDPQLASKIPHPCPHPFHVFGRYHPGCSPAPQPNRNIRSGLGSDHWCHSSSSVAASRTVFSQRATTRLPSV